MKALLLAASVVVAVLPGPALAQAFSVEQLVDACRGGDVEFARLLRDRETKEGKALAPAVVERERAEHSGMARLVCEMYLAGSLDQIIFFFDKDGLLDEADVVCIPATNFEPPTSLRDMLIYKLVNMSKGDLAKDGKRSAKFWIATAMIKQFPCNAPVRGKNAAGSQAPRAAQHGAAADKTAQ